MRLGEFTMELIEVHLVTVKNVSAIAYEIYGNNGDIRFVMIIDNQAIDFDSLRSARAYMIGYFSITGVEI